MFQCAPDYQLLKTITARVAKPMLMAKIMPTSYLLLLLKEIRSTFFFLPTFSYFTCVHQLSVGVAVPVSVSTYIAKLKSDTQWHSQK